MGSAAMVQVHPLLGEADRRQNTPDWALEHAGYRRSRIYRSRDSSTAGQQGPRLSSGPGAWSPSDDLILIVHRSRE